MTDTRALLRMLVEELLDNRINLDLDGKAAIAYTATTANVANCIERVLERTYRDDLADDA